MITISGERGFVRVKSWDEVLTLPGFKANIDYKATKLTGIIGQYIFAERMPCGLASCRTPHGRGFIVTVEGGDVTNIGKDCGKTHFGVDFVTMSRTFSRDAANAQRREDLTTFQAAIPELRARIEDLRNAKQGDWVFKTSQLFRSSTLCPKIVRETLAAMARERDARLMKKRLETESEAAAREALSGRRDIQSDDDEQEDRRPFREYMEEQIALIDGLPILYAEHDLRNLLIVDVLPRLRIIESLTVTGLSDAQLRDHARWIATKDEKLGRAERAIGEGIKFLRRPNLSPFMQLLDHASDRQALSRLLRLLPE